MKIALEVRGLATISSFETKDIHGVPKTRYRAKSIMDDRFVRNSDSLEGARKRADYITEVEIEEGFY